MYHDNYFEDNDNGHRKGNRERLDMILNNVSMCDSVLDIGCADGYFSFGLADAEIATMIHGIDTSKDSVENCRKIMEENSEKIKKPCHVFFSCGNVKDFLDFKADLTIYMSVHHHLIEQLGWNEAKEVLCEISDNCETMIFDMGQKNEHGCTKYGWWNALPSGFSNEEAIMTYLKANTNKEWKCIGSTVVHGVDRFLFRGE